MVANVEQVSTHIVEIMKSAQEKSAWGFVFLNCIPEEQRETTRRAIANNLASKLCDASYSIPEKLRDRRQNHQKRIVVAAAANAADVLVFWC